MLRNSLLCTNTERSKCFNLHPDGTMIVYQRFFDMVYEGKAFYCSKRWDSLSGGDYIDIYMETPTSSSKDIYVVIIEIASTNVLYIDFYHNNEVITAGTDLPKHNLNFKSTNTPVFIIREGGSYNLGTLVHQGLIPGGPGAVRAVGGAAEIGEAIIVPPSHNMLLRMTNPSATSISLYFRIIWWEE